MQAPRIPGRRALLPARSRRAKRCDACWLPSALCVCAALPHITVRTRVVVVMHRNEHLKSSNTGRLAALVLEGAEVRVRGRDLIGPGSEARELGPDLHPGPRPDAEPAVGSPEGRRLMLFPGASAPELSRAHGDGGPVTLLVPDGSWAQARKLSQRDESLRDAEPVRLPAGPASRYLLRRNAREGTVCTFEAIARALEVLEGGGIEASMLEVLDLFQERSLHFRRPLGRTRTGG